MTQALENLLSEERSFRTLSMILYRPGQRQPRDSRGGGSRLPGDSGRTQALERITWFKEPTEVLDDSNPPFYKWFKDGELNLVLQLPRSASGRAWRSGRLLTGLVSPATTRTLNLQRIWPPRSTSSPTA